MANAPPLQITAAVSHRLSLKRPKLACRHAARAQGCVRVVGLEHRRQECEGAVERGAVMIDGVFVWASAPALLVNAAPARWAWPERRAASPLGEAMWPVGERLLSTADPERWRRLTADGSGGQDAGGDKADRGVRSASNPSSKTAKVRKPRRANRSNPDRSPAALT